MTLFDDFLEEHTLEARTREKQMREVGETLIEDIA